MVQKRIAGYMYQTLKPLMSSGHIGREEELKNLPLTMNQTINQTDSPTTDADLLGDQREEIIEEETAPLVKPYALLIS